MHTRITIIGSGTCVPSLHRSSCSVLVRTEATTALFDCGPGSMRRLLEVGVTIYELDYLFFSHFHPDHTGELVPLIFANKYPDASRRRLPLTLVGGSGFTAFYSGLKDVYGEWVELDNQMLRLLEIDSRQPSQVTLNDFNLSTGPVAHRRESLAYRIQDRRGRSIVYSGDTDVSDTLVELASNADLFICESAFPDAEKVEGHLTPSLAGQIATRAGVRRLVLTHLYPACDQADLAAECRRTYTGPLTIAEDLMTLEVE